MPKDIPQGFFYRDSDHSYFLDGKRMTGCTTVLGVIAKPQLIPWAARMACDYIRENGKKSTTEYTQSDKETEISYEVTEEQLKEAEVAHTKKKDDGATAGTDTHAQVENFVKECIADNNGYPLVERTLTASVTLTQFIHWAYDNNIRFLSSEERFYSEKYFVAGTADLIFEKDGKRFIGDIKTYKKIWDRVPMFQCAGYALMAEEMGQPKFDGYCIINLPKERNFKESEDIAWTFDTENDTKAFLACLTIYRQLANWK